MQKSGGMEPDSNGIAYELRDTLNKFMKGETQ